MRTLSLVVALLAPQLTHAGIVDTSETPRTMVLDLRFGSYRPNLDDAFTTVANQTPPYEETFSNASETMFLLNLEIIFLEQFGTLSGGLGVGFWDVEGATRRRTPQAGEDTTGADKTTLQIIPTQMQLSYRLDYWQESIPLVPLFRVGFDYYFWEVLDDDSEVTSFEAGQPAEGGTWGTHVSIGAQLYLDFLAPGSASVFDREAGVNNSYLTFEYQIAKVDDFGAADSFRLGDETFLFGLTLDL